MSENSFEGFIRSNTTPIPDVLFDELLSLLTGAELKVLLYIMRRTWGFKKDADAIALSQFEHGITTQDGRVLDRGCGLNRETICKALKSLEKMGCIKSEKQFSKHGDKDITVYKIRFKEGVGGKSDHPEKADRSGGRKNEPPVGGKSDQEVDGLTDQGGRKNPKKVVGKTDLQETVVQQTDKQETERETPTVEVPEPAPLSPSSESLFKKLTEEQSQFWDRWNALSHCGDQAFNETAKGHVVELAGKVTTTTDLQSLYDYAYDRIKEFAKAKGEEPVPPRLGNLVKRYGDWKAAQDAKKRDREQSSIKTVSGSGAVQNWTQARLSGKAPPIVYDDPPQARKKMNNMGLGPELAAFQEMIMRRRKQKEEEV
jgi:hypothetical protein